MATRAGGHFATLYTHIDDLVESVRAITPRGTWESRRLPGSGAGPSPDRALIGSEGILGVIAEAWVRVRPRPEFKSSCGVEFDDFHAAARAIREISQAGLYPSNCRLLDALEAGTTGAGSGEKNLMVLGFESAHRPMDALMRQALEIAQSHGGTPGIPRATGPAPYFTVIAPAVRGSEVEQWDEIKAAAAEAVIEGGGSITHRSSPRSPALVRPPA
ncbi:MAG TPA: FAD-linked oxidase C-terminal domain-containing protein, partial [Thermoanaerobaculia bacterium]